jgi:PAS domain-containing protein
MAIRLKHERDRVLGGIGIGRRRAVALVGGGLAAGWHLWGSGGRATAAEPPPPVRMVTRGPGHHWFGYYDKLQFDPTGRRLLGMQVAFEHRSPRVDDEIRIGMVDLADGDRWLDLGGSRAWSWQQGCMLQWRPGSAHEILWNDRDHDRFVTRLLDVATGRLRTLSRAIYTVAPDGRLAFGLDFGRLQRMRPGYGYATDLAPEREDPAPRDAGIWSIDLDSGAERLIVSLAEILGFEPQDSFSGANHWFNHLLVNTDSTRLELLHRWAPPGGRWQTRMLTMNLDGSEPFTIGLGLVSHFIWRDVSHILAWMKPAGREAGFWLCEDRTGRLEQVGAGVMTQDGHCTYLTGNQWILNDTYPDRERMQRPYLFEVATGRRVPLGAFVSPQAYVGEWRCDTHPRSSPDGQMVCIDSPVGDSASGGQGRQLHVIDVSGIVGA